MQLHSWLDWTAFCNLLGFFNVQISLDLLMLMKCYKDLFLMGEIEVKIKNLSKKLNMLSSHYHNN